ncbi:MAG: glutamate dehydrogenase [Propionibacteriales bacterium]|nr:glutamate dehydrogenase [Propionibacteriales bacterium]
MAPSPRPYLRLVWSDPESAATGYVVVDRLVTGIATGGLRMRPGCTLAEVEDLAREMSLKTACYRLPVGGAKGGIDYPADADDADAVRERFVRAVRPLLDSIWTTAGDLGTPQSRLDAVFERLGLGPSSLRAGLLRSPDRATTERQVQRLFTLLDDGLVMPSLIGGYGVAEAALAGLDALGIPAGSARAVVQGFGAMGGSSALYLHRAGARVVGISDAGGLLVNTERGLDVPHLLGNRTHDGLIDRAALRADDEQRARDDWLDLPCEVVVPAATSYSVTEDNCARLQTRLVVEAANVPLTQTAEASLLGRGVPVIPDFVANAGAAAWAWWAMFGLVTDADDSRAMVTRHVRPLVAHLMEEWLTAGVAPRKTAGTVAEHNLAEMSEQFGDVDERVPLYTAGATSARHAMTDDTMGRHW